MVYLSAYVPYFEGLSTLISHEKELHHILLLCPTEGFLSLFVQKYSLDARPLDTGERARSQTDKFPFVMKCVSAVEKETAVVIKE